MDLKPRDSTNQERETNPQRRLSFKVATEIISFPISENETSCDSQDRIPSILVNLPSAADPSQAHDPDQDFCIENREREKTGKDSRPKVIKTNISTPREGNLMEEDLTRLEGFIHSHHSMQETQNAGNDRDHMNRIDSILSNEDAILPIDIANGRYKTDICEPQSIGENAEPTALEEETSSELQITVPTELVHTIETLIAVNEQSQVLDALTLLRKGVAVHGSMLEPCM